MIKINESDILTSKDNKDISNKVFNNINEIINTLTNHDEILENQLINENYIFNKKDLYINFDKFESGNSNILLITGLSGSGKSTLAKSLATKYKAEYIELDQFEFNYNYTDNRLTQLPEVLQLYLKNNWHLRNKENIDKMSKEEFKIEFNKYFTYLISYCDKDKKFIIEGVQIFNHIESSKIQSKPMILIGKSLFTSYIQSLKRVLQQKENGMTGFINYIKDAPEVIKWYIGYEKNYQNFIKQVVIKENFNDYINNDDIILQEESDYYKIVNGEKTIDQEAIKKKIKNINSEKDLNIVFTKLMNMFKSVLSVFMYVLSIATIVTIVAIPFGMVGFIIANMIDSSINLMPDEKKKQLTKLYKTLQDEKEKVNEKLKNEKDIKKKEAYRKLIMELDKGMSNIKSNTDKKSNHNNTNKNQFTIYFMNSADNEDDITKNDIKKWLKERDKTSKDRFCTFEMDYLEIIFFCDYMENDLIRIATKNEMTDYYLKTIKTHINNDPIEGQKVLDYFKNKSLAEIAIDGSGNNLLYCKEDRKLYYFEHEDYPQIDLKNTSTLSALIAESKKRCLNNKGLMYLYNNKKELIKEEVVILNELKEFPLQFNREGDLIIKNLSKLDYQQEYQKSHKLLLSYEKTNAIEGIKYEISKLWLLNSELEKKIYDPKESKKKREYTLVRARILNDFNKYLKLVNKQEKDFNFVQYYNHTPFSDASIRISKDTLFHTGEIIKHTIKGILL